MRLATAILALMILATASGSVLADPNTPAETKPWSFDFGTPRATYPEAGANDTCPGTQALVCGDLIDPGEISTTADDDWYQLYLTAGTIVTIGTDVGSGGCAGVGDSYLYLYAPDCATLLASDDDSGPGLYSLIVSYGITTTGYYNIKVQSYGHYYTGCYKLFVNCTGAEPPPPNDLCSGAIAISSCTSGSLNGDLTWGNNDYDPGSGGCASGYPEAGKDVAYVTVLQVGDSVDLTYTGNGYDSAIYIVTDCSNVAGTCVIGADASYNVEVIHWVCNVAGTYYIIADAYGTNAGGTFTLAYTLTCPPPTGACCFADGSCVVLSESDCQAQGGVWYGSTAPCSPNPCPQPVGACCFPDGTCLMLSQAECFGWDGAWLGPGTNCNPNPCVPPPPEGACCYPDGSCVVTTEQECIAEQRSGIWMGPGTDCDPNPCVQPEGACCFSDCTCLLMTEVECVNSGGVFYGPGVSCDPNPCSCPPVACCLPDGSCWVVTQFECEAMGGTPSGYSDCEPNPCVGACCFADCTCVVLTEAECAASGGVFTGAGSSCEPLPCPCPPGACCFPDGTCIFVVQSQCVGGIWMMDVPCDPNPCPQPGACCFVDGTCQVMLEEECLAALGDWYGDTDPDCDPNPCPPPTPVEHESWGRIKSRYR